MNSFSYFYFFVICLAWLKLKNLTFFHRRISSPDIIVILIFSFFIPNEIGEKVNGKILIDEYQLKYLKVQYKDIYTKPVDKNIKRYIPDFTGGNSFIESWIGSCHNLELTIFSAETIYFGWSRDLAFKIHHQRRSVMVWIMTMKTSLLSLKVITGNMNMIY